jgi:outer membrane protein assembly factor BamB
MMNSDEAASGGVRFIAPSCIRPATFFALLLLSAFLAGIFGCRRGDEESKQSNDASTVQRADAVTEPKSSTAQLAHSSDWPVFRGDAQATGVARGHLPAKLELLWTFSTAKGGFESTAAIVDGGVYIGSTDGNLYALDLATGKKRWEFATPLGFSASAAVQGGRVYIGDTDGKFYCIDAANGKKLWDYATDGEINSSANFHAGHVLFGSQDSYLYCLNAESGKLVWKYQSPNQIRCSPVVADDRGFVAGCDGSLHIIDLTKGTEAGAVKIDSPTGNTPAAMDGNVFVGTEGNSFFAVDPKRAKILWQYEAREHRAAYRSSAAVTPAAVIVGSRDKQIHALSPKNGRPLWSFATKGRVDSSPVVVGDRVFVGSGDGRVYAIDIKSGAKLWQFEAGGAVIASAAVADGRLVIGNDSGQLYCFGAK